MELSFVLYDNKLLWITEEGNVEFVSSVTAHYKLFGEPRMGRRFRIKGKKSSTTATTATRVR